MNILKFEINGEEIEVFCNKGKIAFTFEGDNKRYENAISLPSRKTDDVIAASLLLFTNAMEAINENKRLREEATREVSDSGDKNQS